MKYLGIFMAALFAVNVAQAELKQHTFSASAVTTNQATASQSIKGVIKSIYFNVPAGKTGDVAFVSSEGFTIFDVNDVSADTLYVPQTPVYTAAGAAITVIGANDGGTSVASVVYADIPVVGTVTATFEPNADTTGTNTWTALVTYEE